MNIFTMLLQKLVIPDYQMMNGEMKIILEIILRKVKGNTLFYEH